jgi:hypothetical protein
MRPSQLGRLLPASLLAVCVLSGCAHQAPPPLDPSVVKPIEVVDAAPAAAQEKQRDANAETAGPEAKRYALLVGCTTYVHLPPRVHLKGPANDVKLLSDRLQKLYKFPARNILILSEAEGARDPQQLPSRENIERAFKRLAEKADIGVQIVVLLSGHGEQQLEPNPPPDLRYAEPDGLDEVFLPRDAKLPEKRGDPFPNAIVDDEIRVWTGNIVKKGASLWLIADCCHSGTILRGDPNIVPRCLPPEMSVPPKVRAKAKADAAKRGVQVRGGAPHSPFRLEPEDEETGKRLVAVAAAQSSEKTFEMPFPGDGPNDPWQGLLTWTVCEVLSQAKTPPTYRELVQRVRLEYDRMGGNLPTPVVDGKDLDREVLGEKEFPGRSRFVLAGNGDVGWKVTGGKLHGFNSGTIFEVYPINQKNSAGHVRITTSRLLDADVAPCTAEGKDATLELKPGWPCVPRVLNYGNLRLKVAADVVEEHRTLPTTEEEARTLREKHKNVRAQLVQDLRKLAAEKNAPLEVVEGTVRPDWIVRADARGSVQMLPAQGVELPDADGKAETPSKSQLLLGPYAPDVRVKKLRDALRGIARAKNLIGLADPKDQIRTGNTVKLGVEILRCRDADPESGEPIRFQKEALVLKSGDLIAFRVKNLGKAKNIFVTLLFVDGGYGIRPLYPREDDAADALAPGKSVVTGVLKVTAKTTGRERLLAIGIQSRTPVDFTCLAQPSLREARATVGGSRGPESLDTPLGQLMLNASYAEGGRRDLVDAFIDNHAIDVISWEVVPGANPK